MQGGKIDQSGTTFLDLVKPLNTGYTIRILLPLNTLIINIHVY
jgi:hypothetical protein